MRRKSQACPIWCSYENQGETLLSTCGYTCTNFSSGSKRKRRIKKLLKVGVNSLFYFNGTLRNLDMPEKK